MDLNKKLKEMGLELPMVTKPGGSYSSVNIRADIAYVSIQFPIRNGSYLFQGRLGEDTATIDGIEAMELCALNVLAQIHEKVGFENVIGLNHVDAYFQSSNEWDEGPKVVDGASKLFLHALGEKGKHSRSIVGVHKLPRNFSVGLTTNFTIKKHL